MDPTLLHHVTDALWALTGKAVDFCLGLGQAALLRLLEALAWLAQAGRHLAAGFAALPLWLTIPSAVVLAVAVAGYVLRQKLYDRLLIYHDIWLRRQGYRRQEFTVRRGAVRQRLCLMARPVTLPERFRGLAVCEVAPDRYGVAFGLVGGIAEDFRLYRRDRRAGLVAMGTDLIRHFRANARLLHADGEARVLFALLDARDPYFAAWRPVLPGERPWGERTRCPEDGGNEAAGPDDGVCRGIRSLRFKRRRTA